MRIGFVGTGILGTPMVERLLAVRNEVAVYNRTPAKLERLRELGAVVAKTPAEAADGNEVVISVVTDPEAVLAVTNGPNGIATALQASSVHCDMSTVTPQSAARLAAEYAAHGGRFVQAPVMGSKKQIIESTLVILAGGSDDDIDICERAWSAFAGQVWRLPDAEQAATSKLACNMLIAQMIVALGQTLLYARKGGVDPAIVLDIIQSSNLAAPMYASKGKTLIERNFTPNFFVRNMLKDLNLAALSASEFALPQPLNATARELFVSAVARGYGDEDYSAVVKVLEDLAGESAA